jgi:hypothetical protein
MTRAAPESVLGRAKAQAARTGSDAFDTFVEQVMSAEPYVLPRPVFWVLADGTLGPGPHTLDVRAVDPGGRPDPSPQDLLWPGTDRQLTAG